MTQAEEEEKRERAKASIQDMEIDPRGFVVPKVHIPGFKNPQTLNPNP